MEIMEKKAFLDRLRTLGTKLDPRNWDQFHYIVAFVVFALTFFIWILASGFASGPNALAMFSAQLCAVAAFLLFYFALIAMLCGFGVKVLDKIFVNGNIAAAVFLAGLAYAISNCISRAALG